jgi:hypothetical protein
MRHVYTVEQAVGIGGANRRDDVLLVQFFLKVAMLDSPNSKPYIPPGEQPISIDGSCGPQTCRYIKFYQEEGNRRNPGVKTTTEGRIDPVAGGSLTSSISHTFYTILALNVSYKDRRGKDLHEDISKDPLFPAELAKSLYV